MQLFPTPIFYVIKIFVHAELCNFYPQTSSYVAVAWKLTRSYCHPLALANNANNSNRVWTFKS